MEKTFSIPITSISTHPTNFDTIAVGKIDGSVTCYRFNLANDSLTPLWSQQLKQSIRAIEFSECGVLLVAISANRAICVFDVESGKRLRCIKRSHSEPPNCLCILPSWISGGQQFASGAEDGEIRTWDFRADEPIVETFKEQEDVINAFGVWKNALLAVSDDSTISAYDIHKRRLRTKSETMHSELLSIAVTEKYTYVGSSDSHIEVFNGGEYGNILERIETNISMGVNALVTLRPNLLLAGGSMHDELRFIHTKPNKLLNSISHGGGVDILIATKDSSNLLVVGDSENTSLKIWNVKELIKEIPILKPQDVQDKQSMAKKKFNNLNSKATKNGFYQDLISDQKNRQSSSSDESDDDEEESEIESDD